MAEKRKQKRKAKRLYVRYFSHDLEFRGNTSNFSSSGLFIRTSKPFRPGVPVKIAFKAQEDREICLHGICVRSTKNPFTSSKNGMGVQISSKPEDYEKFLSALY